MIGDGPPTLGGAVGFNSFTDLNVKSSKKHPQRDTRIMFEPTPHSPVKLTKLLSQSPMVFHVFVFIISRIKENTIIAT